MNKQTKFALAAALVTGTAALLFYRRRASGTAAALPNQAIYRFYAPVYDRLFGATYAAARQRTVHLLELRPGEELLISGVGTGLDLPQIPAGVAVTGVDISTAMLEQAARKPSHGAVQLMEMDAQCLDFPNDRFEAALLSLIVSVAPDGRAVFQEAWRVLKPGGRLVLFDKFAPEGQQPGLLRKAAGWLFRQLGTDVNRKISDVLGDAANGAVEINEPSVFFGQYRILRLRKRHPEEF